MDENSILDIPMLLFSSNGENTGWDGHEWIAIQKNFVNSSKNANLIILDSSHYIHTIDFERIARDAEIYINQLGNVQ